MGDQCLEATDNLCIILTFPEQQVEGWTQKGIEYYWVKKQIEPFRTRPEKWSPWLQRKESADLK